MYCNLWCFSCWPSEEPNCKHKGQCVCMVRINSYIGIGFHNIKHGHYLQADCTLLQWIMSIVHTCTSLRPMMMWLYAPHISWISSSSLLFKRDAVWGGNLSSVKCSEWHSAEIYTGVQLRRGWTERQKIRQIRPPLSPDLAGINSVCCCVHLG
jgi:hypothetical protein